jgi:hypothetical protein
MGIIVTQKTTAYAAAVSWLTACLVAYRQYEKRTDLNLLNELVEIE